uniref:Thioredoxin domain-containing protein n=1 Tax=Chlamydomonas leiostraca TaxID=1034604 RepID=A0A7S0S358_9CHLO|mmetsp:Transcript_37675/g.95227  ORF Transcript_37675/g.95227 Transcript_37675/m.95227 type:complete len:187 (+) Transcript_37675:127-687(+)|eukprot:CAMPEP_0202858374 /NCGR_PEP_ID=MMETSP1391-20130828/937_1 /ASSEMBLY_ACC=CAM_ASM_000867 /TAXON_ID=1034604 /ORGANISM="Chlamydomonas leiostraca, Strain SAG 11-49" /LENGTH=186 /DNA_ID=CAMNT_0049537289 /DNA_START=126 /DNA_END=686 /DNA_ORIENTATION=-
MATTPEGESFSFTELLGEKLLAKELDQFVEVNTRERLDGKWVCLYFSAHWCPPCKAFTPILRKFYLYCLAKNKAMEVVFISADNNKQEFEDYYLKNMPWLTLAWDGNEPRRSRLSRRYQVLGIPSLVILSPEGKVANRNARAALVRDPEGKNFPWPGDEDRSVGGWVIPLIALLAILAIYWFFGQK